MTDYELMGAALEEAARAAALGEVPVGAVVARNGEIIAAAHNTRETEKNALHHAELLAIDAACKKLGGWRLWQCELFVTLEPCPMCSGGIINSRIRRVVYGAADTKAGCCGSVTDPEKGYYLSLRPGRRSDEVKAILSAAGLDIGTTVRRGEELLYYRDSGKIEDFLAFVGQPKYALELMDKKITKNLRNNANRLANAETANYDRAATASAEQVAAIKLLIKNKEFNRLSPELAESARLRLEYPDLDLASLALMHSKKVSKSGLSHRMARLIEMAGKYM